MSKLSISKQQHEDFEVFEHGVLASKFALIAGLTALSYHQGDTAFISKDPSSFLTECFLVGASAAIPTVMFAYNRIGDNGIDKSKVINGMFLTFMLFFIFHLVMELSGMNNRDTKDITTGDEEQQKFISHWKIFGYIAAAIYGMVMTRLALNSKDFTMMREQPLTCLTEMAVVGLANALPAYKILKHRGKGTKEALKSSIVMGALYSAGYVGLQSGGFFSSIFNDVQIDYKMK